MNNLYPADRLLPGYAILIEKEKRDAAVLTERLANNIAAIEYDGSAIIDTAVRIRWLEGVVEWIKSDADRNGGMVNRDTLKDHIQSRLIQLARGGSWSSNPVKALVERAEMEVLAKASEPFNLGLMQPFDSIDNERRSAEWQAKREAATWYVKKGNTYLGWENKSVRSIERAKPFRYEDRPALLPGWSYEMVEAA